MDWSIECRKFVQDEDTLEWKIVPMTVKFHDIYGFMPDTWTMDDGSEIPVFRLEYVGLYNDGGKIDMVSYILSDFRVVVCK